MKDMKRVLKTTLHIVGGILELLVTDDDEIRRIKTQYLLRYGY